MFNEWILSDLVKDFPAVLRHYAEGSLIDGHEIVFAHEDLHRRNILVEKAGSQPSLTGNMLDGTQDGGSIGHHTGLFHTNLTGGIS